MNTFKKILLVMLSVVSLSAIALAVGCKKPTPPPEPQEPVIEFTVDSSKVKKEYLVTEEFDGTGLVVVANVDDNGEKSTINDYTLDRSAYDKTKVGTYEIKVSVTYKEKTLTEKFEVKVANPTFDGLSIALAEGVADTYTLTAQNTKVEIDLTKIVVKEIDPRLGTPLSAITDYTVELYKDATKVEVTDNKAQVGGGSYQIWASKKSAYTDYMRKAFVLIHVVDPIVSISLKNGATLEQQVGDDVISSTWNFTATYTTGATKDLTLADVAVTGLDTTTEGEKTAVVTFSDIASDGTKTDKTVNVNYTVTSKVNYETVKSINFSNVTPVTITEEGPYVISDKDGNDTGFTYMNAASKTAKVVEKTLEGYSYTGRFETGGTVGAGANNSFKFSLGAGTYKIKVVYNQNKDGRSCTLLKGVDGAIEKLADSTANMTVAAADMKTHIFDLTLDSETDLYLGSTTGGGLYFYEIKVDKVVDSTESEATEHTYTFNLNALADQAKTGETWTDKMTATAAMFAGDNAFLTFTGESTASNNMIRTGSSNTKVTGFETKGDALCVTFIGTGTISITFCSNGSDPAKNISCLGLKKSDGTLLEGAPSDTTNVTVSEGMYAVVTSATSYTVTFTITEAGTYTISTGCKTHDRVVRISGITMVDTY